MRWDLWDAEIARFQSTMVVIIFVSDPKSILYQKTPLRSFYTRPLEREDFHESSAYITLPPAAACTGRQAQHGGRNQVAEGVVQAVQLVQAVQVVQGMQAVQALHAVKAVEAVQALQAMQAVQTVQAMNKHCKL